MTDEEKLCGGKTFKEVMKEVDFHISDKERIEQLEKENEELNRDKTELVNSVTELKTKVTELEKENKEILEDNDTLNKWIEELKEQIEKMKCCGNCKHEQDSNTNYYCENCKRFANETDVDKWELAE